LPNNNTARHTARQLGEPKMLYKEARAAAQAQVDALIERIGSAKFNATLAGAAK